MRMLSAKRVEKGQTFLIIAIVVIILLIMLKTSLNLLEVIENKRYLESSIDRLSFENLRSELTKTIQISYEQSNITENIEYFVHFSRRILNQRGFVLKAVLIQTVHPIVAAGVETRLNISILNLLGEEMLELDLDLNGSVKNYTFVSDATSVTSNFTINTATDANYSLTVDYQTASGAYSEILSIPVELNKSKYVALYDLQLVTDRSEQRDKIEKIIEMP